MNQFSEFLMQKAAELSITPEMEAVELLKEAGVSEEDAKVLVAQELMEKEAFSILGQRGIDPEDAMKLVKAAKIDVSKLNSFNFDIEKPVEAVLIEKAAAYIETLHEQIEALQKSASSRDEVLFQTKQAFEEVTSTIAKKEARQEREKSASDSMERLNRSGAFTKEDLEALLAVDQSVLTKVASVMDQPWDMGSGSGMKRQKTDAIIEFILS